MKNSSKIILKAFLTQAKAANRALDRFLPEEEREFLSNLEIPFKEPLVREKFDHKNLLEKIHWSWFLPTLKSYSAKEQTFFLSTLKASAAKNLARELQIEDCNADLKEAAKRFLQGVLLCSLVGQKDRLLPIEYLPSSSLSPLLQYNKRQLIQLIEFLSLYDLGVEMRQIVETKILKKIYSFLSENERAVLKELSPQKEPLPRLLDRWDGSEESFRLQLHKRGLSRLAAAISGQDADFIWYVCHQLDIGRGNALFKLSSKSERSEIAIRQVEDFFAKEKAS